MCCCDCCSLCKSHYEISDPDFGIFFPQTLLELGASPDYKDSYGLTPLYHTAIVGGDPYCCELLLHEHATVCCKDENGWHEIHQVRVPLPPGASRVCGNLRSVPAFSHFLQLPGVPKTFGSVVSVHTET